MQIWQVNAFTKELFKGNPAGVVLVDEFYPDNFMQNVACEMNYSETAFVKKNSNNHYHIRWFSPKDEAPLCGHATLASAHLLFEQNLITTDTITFDSKAGILIVKKESNNTLTLNFPKFKVSPTPLNEDLHKSLNFINVLSVHKDSTMYIVELASVQDVLNFEPNLFKMMELDLRAVCITAQNNNELPEIDFVSRYFAPKVGILEDPVCGSAHCRLTPFWKERLNKEELVAMQLSQRTGILKVSCDDSRVYLNSNAITVMSGKLLLEDQINLLKKAS